MSEWMDSNCPRCGFFHTTPIWDEGECNHCGLPFTFDPDRGKKLGRPSQYYWGVPGWMYYKFDTRPMPKWAKPGSQESVEGSGFTYGELTVLRKALTCLPEDNSFGKEFVGNLVDKIVNLLHDD